MIFDIEFEEKEKFDVEFTEQESSFSADFASNIVFPQGKPESAENGATFFPHVSESGIISWTNDKGLANPEPVSIAGPQGEIGPQGPAGDKGEKGEPYTLTDADKAEMVQAVIKALPKYNGEVVEV